MKPTNQSALPQSRGLEHLGPKGFMKQNAIPIWSFITMLLEPTVNGCWVQMRVVRRL